jgi:Rrf2 family transcriptional regulator, cysteine metabolism repressor
MVSGQTVIISEKRVEKWGEMGHPLPSMKLSTRVRYGIRALIDLSKNYSDRPVSIREIARRQGISFRYLENIFHDLKKSGILGSTKGKGGGFYLASSLGQVSLLDLIDILDGEFCIVDCIGNVDLCENAKTCYTRGMWKKLNGEIRETFARVNLEDVLNSME